MALNAAALNVGAVALAAAIKGMQIHSGDPGAAGTANTTTAARQGVTATANGSGEVDIPSTPFTGGAANGPATYVSFWSTATTGGTYYGSLPLTGDQAFNASGAYTVTSVTIPATAS